MSEITFNRKEIAEFINDREEINYTRCGYDYVFQFRLTDEGVIEIREYTFSSRVIVDEEWRSTGIKGVVTD